MRIWISLLLTVFVLTGCGAATKKASPSPQNQANQVPRVQSTNDGTVNPGANRTGLLPQKERQIHLEQLAKRVPGVNGAHVVVMGNTAVVGIDVDAKLERARVGSIKYTVAEALRKDPQGAGAVVTADVDLNQRIAEIGRKIAEGRPIAGLATELADIIGRIVPQVPDNTMPKNNTQVSNDSGNGSPQPANYGGGKKMHMAPGR
ncbi:YhcN/YlaJ family sporulation lipoprotein [Paenibacillus sp. DYY-L-2]|uniref:YhcN/YlaJ family sporulation lipoprotein n=1 Tax=Paenibacillus sp. DYY-L-2 TaxID=3447013 RepID=UPI003F4FD9F7